MSTNKCHAPCNFYLLQFLFAGRDRQARSETRLFLFIARLDQFLVLAREPHFPDGQFKPEGYVFSVPVFG
jgi:hypothetical protein